MSEKTRCLKTEQASANYVIFFLLKKNNILFCYGMHQKIFIILLLNFHFFFRFVFANFFSKFFKLFLLIYYLIIFLTFVFIIFVTNYFII